MNAETPSTGLRLLRPLVLIAALTTVGCLVFREQEEKNPAPLAHSSKSAAPMSVVDPDPEVVPVYDTVDDPGIRELALVWFPAISGKKVPSDKLKTIRVWALQQDESTKPKDFRPPMLYTSKSMAPVPDKGAWKKHCAAIVEDVEKELTSRKVSYPMRGEIVSGWYFGAGGIRKLSVEDLQSKRRYLVAQSQLKDRDRFLPTSKSMAPIPTKNLPATIAYIDAELARRKAQK